MTESTYTVKCNGVPLVINLEKMHGSYIAAIVRKGVQRYFNDELNQLKSDVKLDAYRLELAAAHSGEALPEKVRKERGTASTIDPIAKRTLAEAKLDLGIRFSTALGLDLTKAHRPEEWVEEPRAEKYFKLITKRLVWVDSEVVTFITREKESGGRDFYQEAVDFYASAPKAATNF